MTDFSFHLSTYLREYLPRDRNFSRHTIESYSCSWRLLVIFASERLDVQPCQLEIQQLTVPLILDFLDSLQNTRNNANRTRNIRLAAIKSFFRYLEFRAPECLALSSQVHSIPEKRFDRKLIDWLELHELQALVDAPDIKTASGVRDRAMLHLAFSAGLRVSELTALTLDNLEQPAISTIRVMGKGRRERVLPLWDETRSTLADWLNIRPAVKDNHLFLNARGTAISRHGFAHLLSHHVATVKQKLPSMRSKRITPHVLRHSCAMHILQITGDVRQVSLWLGHASMQSTEIYLHANPAEKLEVLAAGTVPAITKGAFNGMQDTLLRILNNPLL